MQTPQHSVNTFKFGTIFSPYETSKIRKLETFCRFIYFAVVLQSEWETKSVFALNKSIRKQIRFYGLYIYLMHGFVYTWGMKEVTKKKIQYRSSTPKKIQTLNNATKFPPRYVQKT